MNAGRMAIKEAVIEYHVPLDEKLPSALKEEGGCSEGGGGRENPERLPMFPEMLAFSYETALN